MGSDKNFLNDFRRIFEIEHAMGPKVRALMAMTKDPEFLATCEGILKDETRHDVYATALLGLYEGITTQNNELYHFTRNFLDVLLLQTHGKEKRRYVREPYLGVVKLRDQSTLLEYTARCMDLSDAGLGIEISQRIPTDTTYHISIDLYGRSVALEHYGRIAWMKEVVPNTFIGGIEYQPGS